MALEQNDYEELRQKCIDVYKTLYKDTMVFDYCEVPRETRVRLLNDPVYITKTKAMKAGLFKEQLEKLNEVLAGSFVNPEKPADISGTILKALEMQQKLLLEDLGINDDVKNALNITFTQMSREDFEALSTVEVEEGNGNTDLGSDFGVVSDNMSAEEKAKQLLAEKQREERKKQETEENGNT